MKSIFVIDDDEDVREVIVFALENEKFSVSDFHDPREALAAIRELPQNQHPGLIIVDYLMPEMNGHEFIQSLRSEERLRSIPIALSSAMGVVNDTGPYLEGLLHLHKPMELEDLLRVARQYCL